jgi:hypothetical protein
VKIAFAFAIGFLLFAMAAEVQSPFLKITASILGCLFVLSGAMLGWESAKRK